MTYTLKDAIRWKKRWNPISQKWFQVLQVLKVTTNLDNRTQQGLIEETWVDVSVVEEEAEDE